MSYYCRNMYYGLTVFIIELTTNLINNIVMEYYQISFSLDSIFINQLLKFDFITNIKIDRNASFIPNRSIVQFDVIMPSISKHDTIVRLIHQYSETTGLVYDFQKTTT